MPRVFDALEMLSMEGTDGHDMDENDGGQEGVCSCLIYWVYGDAFAER